MNSKDEHQIIEALRSGVQSSTLDEFMNIDYFVILRPIFKKEEDKALAKGSLNYGISSIREEIRF